MADPRLQFILDLDFGAFKAKASEAFNGLKSAAGNLGLDKLGGDIGSKLGLDKLGGLIPGLSTGLSGLGGVMSSLNPIQAGVTLGVKALTEAFNGLVSIGEEFHKAFANIRVGTGATGESLHQLETQFKATFATTADSNIEKLSKNFADLNTQTGLTGEPLQTLTKQFAALEKFGDAPSIRSFTRHLGDFGVPADQASAALDKIFVSSQQTGVPMQKLSDLLTKFGAPLRNFGFSVEEGTALLSRFEKEGVNTELVMGSLRIAAGKFAASGTDLRVGLNDVIKSIKEAGSSSEATALAMKTFGRRAGADMADTIRNGKFEIDGFVKSLKGSKETILGARADISSFSGEFEKLNRQAKVALEPLATLLVGGLTTAAKGVAAVVTPVLQGIGSVVTGFIIPAIEQVVERVTRIGDAFGSIFSALGSFGGATDQVGSAWTLIGDVISQLADVFIGLQSIITEAIVAPVELGAEIIGQMVEFINDISGGAANANSAWTGFNGILNGAKLTLSVIVGAIKGVKDAFASVKDGISDGFGKLLKGDVLGAIKSVKDGIDGAVEGIGDSIGEAVNDQLRDIKIDEGKKAIESQLALSKKIEVSVDLDKLRADLEAATSEAERNDIAAKIAEKVPKAVENVTLVTDEFGNVTKKIELSNEALDKFKEKTAKAAEKDPSVNQQNILDGLQAQFAQQALNNAKADELNGVLEKEKLLHGDNSAEAKKAEEAFDKQKAIVAAGADDLQKSLSGIDASKAFENLSPAAAFQYAKIKEQNASIFTDLEDKAKATELGGVLTEAATLKGDLDANGKLADLQAKFANAKEGLEKNSLGAAIEKQVGIGAVAYDDLGNVISLNTKHIEEFRDANGRSIDAKALSLQAKYSDGLKTQAQALADSRDKAKELAERLNKPLDPATQKTVRDELEKTKGKIGEQTSALQKTVTEGKKFGLIKGDIHNVGTEFKLSAEQARATGTAVGTIKGQAEDASEGIAQMAGEFAELANTAKQAVDADIGAIALVEARKRLNQQASAEELRLADEAAKRLGDDINAQKIYAEVLKSVRKNAGLDAEKKAARVRREFVSNYDGETARLRISIEQKFLEERAANIADANLKELFLARVAAKIQKEEFAADIAQRKDNLKGLEAASADAGAALRDARAKGDAAATASAEAAKKRADNAVAQARRQLNLTQQEQKIKLDTIDRTFKELEEKLKNNIAATVLTANAAEFDALTDVLRQEAETISDATVQGAVERAAALKEVEDRTFQARTRDLLSKSKTFTAFVDQQTEAEQVAYKAALNRAFEAQDKLAETQRAAFDSNDTSEATTANIERLKEAVGVALDGVGKAYDAGQSKVAFLRDKFVAAATVQPADVAAFQTATDDYENATAQLIATQGNLAAALNAGTITQADADAQIAPIIEAADRAKTALQAAGEEAKRTAAANREAFVAQLQALGITDDGVIDQLLKTTRDTANAQAKIATDARAKARENQRRIDLASIDDIAEQEKQAALFKLEDQLQAELAANEGNNAKRIALVTKYLEDKAKIEQDFAEKSTLLVSSGLKLFRQLTASLNDAFKLLRDDQTKAAAEALRKEEADLLDSLRRRTISYKDYIAGVVALDQKRRDSDVASGDVGERVMKALEAAGRKTATTLSDDFRGKASASVLKYSQTINLSQADLKRMGKTAEEASAISDAAFDEAAINISASFGATVADILLKTEDVGQAVLVASLDALNAMIPFVVAAILGQSLATLGPLGLLEAAGLTALFLGAVGVARASFVKASTGIVGVQGPGTTTSDSIPAFISREESIITARGTASNKEALRWLNATGGNLRDYYAADMSPVVMVQPSANADNDNVVRELQAGHAELAEGLRGVERTMNRLTTVVQQQRITAGATVSGGELHFLAEKGKRVW